MTLKIETPERQGLTVFTLSGRMETEHIPELEKLFGSRIFYGSVILDLKELRLADRAAVKFLARCESDGLRIENCPPYIRQWMQKERAE